MAREPDPITDEESGIYDYIDLGGMHSPGVVTLSGHDRKVNWDVKAGHQQTGASTTLKDVPPIEFTASLYLADEDDFAAWPAFREWINSTLKKNGKALDIYHPDLAANDIKSVVKAQIGGVVHDKKGGQTIAIKFQEYAAPKPIKATPLGSTKQGADPNAALKQQLADLSDQFQKTPWSGLGPNDPPPHGPHADLTKPI